MPDPDTSYRGRFAPSPTGPLHLGSLIAALASYLDARSRGGTWLVRMDDLDPPRESPGAALDILECLESHGLYWDEQVTWQSRRGAAYEAALETLTRDKQIFHCTCPRKHLDDAGCCGGNCLNRQGQLSRPWATRVSVQKPGPIAFDDCIQGRQVAHTGSELTDFVVKRKDDLYAYQLAVVVDDAAAQISHIVRGSDLMESTARQIYLQQTLGYATPSYAHLPVITNAKGQKYSKQNHAPALNTLEATRNLRTALAFLTQPEPPAELQTPQALLSFASRHWLLSRVAPELAIEAATGQQPH